LVRSDNRTTTIGIALAKKWPLEERRLLVSCENDEEIRKHFPGMLLESLKRRQREYKQDLGPSPQQDSLLTIKKLLDDAGISPEDIGKVEKVRINNWEGLTKDADGNAVVTPMKASQIVLAPKWAEGPEWPVVQQAAPMQVKLPTRVHYSPKAWKSAVILPDPQIGYRRDLTTANLTGFHCEHAMSLSLQMIHDWQPNLIINLGDVLDLAAMGRWVQEPGFALTTQPALDRGHLWLAEQRTAAENAIIRFLEGNHDRRMQDYIMQNAMAAFGLRRGNTPPDNWPVMSVPYLLRMDELEVEYLPGYPAGITWVNDRLAAVHGSRVKSSGSTAALVLEDERVSTIFGHVHRIEQLHKTKRVRDGVRTQAAYSPGCLCRIDGVVPGVKGAVDPLGRPVVSYENWQQGIAVVQYKDGDAPFHVDLVPIHDHGAVALGKHYAS
jgi:hypothetical protein